MASALSLEGKVALVTGGARGIGKAFTEALLEKGAKVAIVDINEQTGSKTETEFGAKYGKDRIHFVRSDITKLEELRDSYDQCNKIFGNTDIVVNNAGIADEINFEKMIELNLTAVIRSSYMASERMRKDKGGKGGYIINTASIAGLFPFYYFVAYTGAKHGVVGFTKALAKTLGDTERFGIRVAALCPATVRTDLIDFDAWLKLEPSREDDVTLPTFKESLETRIGEIRAETLLEPTQVSDVLLHLISDPGCNGAIVEITPDSAEFVYPDCYTGKKIF